jgi:hypothetical protein
MLIETVKNVKTNNSWNDIQRYFLVVDDKKNGSQILASH